MPDTLHNSGALKQFLRCDPQKPIATNIRSNECVLSPRNVRVSSKLDSFNTSVIDTLVFVREHLLGMAGCIRSWKSFLESCNAVFQVVRSLEVILVFRRDGSRRRRAPGPVTTHAPISLTRPHGPLGSLGKRLWVVWLHDNQKLASVPCVVATPDTLPWLLWCWCVTLLWQRRPRAYILANSHTYALWS